MATANNRVVHWGKNSGHGGCKEGSVHSGLREPLGQPVCLDTARLQIADTGGTSWMRGPRVEIDYMKLSELCSRNLQSSTEKQQSVVSARLTKQRHDQFMAEYPKIFRRRCRSLETSILKPPPHTCYSSQVQDGDISSHLIAIHGQKKMDQNETDLTPRLQAMTNIVQKLPIQRSSTEVKKLCQYLLHFTDLFPSSQLPVSTILPGLASRVYMEELPEKGFSLPDYSGVYIILQGSVEKLSQDPNTRKFSSLILKPGDSFGSLKGGSDTVIIRRSYPMYYTNESCTLLKIPQVDYQRVVQKCISENVREKERLLKSCHLLHGISPSTLGKLGQNITWETFSKSGTVVLSEGETISKIGIIREGSCIAYAQVPDTLKSTEVMVGQLGSGACIGEVFLKGEETQPYTIVTNTPQTKIGWIESWAIKVNEVEKHILPTKEFTLPLLTKEVLRNLYADRLLETQWGKIKKHIVGEVLTERGIRRGTSKWLHSASNPGFS